MPFDTSIVSEGITYGARRANVSYRPKAVPELTPHPEMYYVYVLKDTETKELYYGFTNDLERRICEHHNKNQRWNLIYYEAYKAESDARNRERRLKNYAQALTALKTRLEESLK